MAQNKEFFSEEYFMKPNKKSLTLEDTSQELREITLLGKKLK